MDDRIFLKLIHNNDLLGKKKEISNGYLSNLHKTVSIETNSKKCSSSNGSSNYESWLPIQSRDTLEEYQTNREIVTS